MLRLRSLAVDQDEGQNLVEYALLMAFFALMASSIFIAAGLNTRSVWAVSNTHLAAANSAVSRGGSDPAAVPAAPPPASTPGGLPNESEGRAGGRDGSRSSR